MEVLSGVHHFDKMPSGLKTAEEVSEAVRLSAARLLELADAYVCPHYRVEGGEPLFLPTEVRKWVAKHLLQRHDGRESLDILVVDQAPKVVDAPPAAIKHVEGLRQLPTDFEPGIYFLCLEGEVVYVGQSVSPIARVKSHKADKVFTHVFFLPVPKSELNLIESKFIHGLAPRLNGNAANGGKVAPISKAACQHDGEGLGMILP